MFKNFLIVLLFFSTAFIQAQYEYRWLSVGSFHSYYTEIGSEIEEGRIKSQQDGLQWPGIYKWQDMSAAKALWIGCKDFTDPSAGFFPYRVVHVGPRVSGGGEFFPVFIKLVSKFDAPIVTVDGKVTFDKSVDLDEIDPNLVPDRMIVNQVNNLLGITMTRKIFQFSNPYYDNCLIHEYTFVNTGNTDKDADIELSPVPTLKDVYFYFNYRWAVCRETRYVVGNGSGWGMNTMLDARGDGVLPDPTGENFRTQFAWHGYWPSKVVSYNNIGGPIWSAANSSGYVATSDTVGRLGASQFIGTLTLFASTNAKDSVHIDNPKQPTTSQYQGSDIKNFSNNSAFNAGDMQAEYVNLMSSGHSNPRHGYQVHPAAMQGGTINFKEFANQNNPPEIGTPGGFSAINSYGPYTMAKGDTVKIIMVDGASGISREKSIEMGKKYKSAYGTTSFATVEKEKNEFVLTGKDSLMQTWRRISDAYKNNWNVPKAPKPPKSFKVNSGGDKIILSWDVYESDPNLQGFEIYRAVGQYDSAYYLIYTASKDQRSYEDKSPVRGLQYYYYIVSVGQSVPNNSSLNIPAHNLKSSRYYTQTYDAAFLKRPAGIAMNQIRVVPNPFILSADDRLLFGKPGVDNAANKIAFFNIPGNCNIKIYTELGELIKTIEHTDGTGDASWDCLTSSNQVVVSGIYIAVITNDDTGEKLITKFSVIR